MKTMLHRFHHPGGLEPGSVIELAEDEHHHAARVVRIRPGEAVEVFDGTGTAGRGLVESIDRHRTRVRIVERLSQSRESPLAVTLALAAIQPDRFEVALQKATELGVTEVVPLITERGEVSAERTEKKLGRWRKIILEAVKQSGRSRIPSLSGPVTLEEALSMDLGIAVVFDADAEPEPVPGATDRVQLFIGPEGGWTPAEIQLARDRGASFVRLGPRRLRAETGAVVAMTWAGLRFGDLAGGT